MREEHPLLFIFLYALFPTLPFIFMNARNMTASLRILLLLISVVVSYAFSPQTTITRPSPRTSTRRHSSTTQSSNNNKISQAAPQQEIDRRRNLAIISHPDSGKTTMTEKLLLYGGALQQAGAVRQKAEQRATQSDFMQLEQERGISISSTVMNFDYQGYGIRLLDTVSSLSSDLS